MADAAAKKKEDQQINKLRDLVFRKKYLSISPEGEVVSGNMEHLTRFVIVQSIEGKKKSLYDVRCLIFFYNINLILFSTCTYRSFCFNI